MDQPKHPLQDATPDGSDPLFTTDAVASWLGIKKCTLEKARSTRIGNFPPHVRVGRAVRYRRSDVEAWLRANTFNVDGTPGCAT